MEWSTTNTVGASKEEPKTCMICLQEKALDVKLPCNCRMVLHEKCWEKFYTGKGHRECLLCRKQFPLDAEKPVSDKLTNSCAACCCCCLLIECILAGIYS